VLILVLLIAYGIFQTAGRISKRFGTTGLRIMQRIMGLLLMVIAVQFIIDGVTVHPEGNSRKTSPTALSGVVLVTVTLISRD